MAVTTLPNQTGTETNDAPKAEQATAMLVPFIRASDEHLESAFVDESQTLDASSHPLGVHDVPSYGYLRYVDIKVTATGGAAGLATVDYHEDGPFNVLQNIQLKEPNGAYIVQLSDGYQLYLANKWGGYNPPYAADPRNAKFFDGADTDGNFTFILRVPVELSGRDGLGSLPNQDSAGQFKLQLDLAPASTVFDTEPDTLPSVRVQAFLHAWDQPEQASGNAQNQVQPPAVGTTGYWSVQSGNTINAGQQTVELKRKGNFIRTWIFVLRRAGTSRTNGESDWPAITRFSRDAFGARYYDDDIWRELMFQRSGFAAANEAANGLDNGVRVHDYMHEFTGGLGAENRDLWQPTRGSTRLELDGSWGNAGTLDIITHDVAVAENVFL